LAHIFISYSRRDTDTLRELASALEAAGHSIWWDVRSIRAGADWQRAIGTGIVDSDAVILMLSTHSVASEWVRKELEIARSQHKAILPVRVDGIAATDFPEFIRDESIHVLDAYPDQASGFAQLTRDLLGLQDHGLRLPFTPAHPRLAQFVGRDQELREIHALLSATKGTGRARVAVCGMGGIGKTQLCIEYVHRYRYFYPDGIVYLDAQANLNEQLARLTYALGLASPPEGLPVAERRDMSAEAVTQHLQGLKGALLFLDNVPSVRSLRRERIGHFTPILALPVPILLNSRSRIEGSEVDRIDLGPLSDEEATALLLKGRPELRDDPQATTLARVLGGVPLALALAAAFFSKKPKATPRSYLAELEEHGWEATLSLGHLKAGDIEAYPQASFVPALRAQWSLLDLNSTPTLLAAAALHPPNTPIPIMRLGLLSGLSDSSDGMRTELSDAVLEAMTLSLATDAGASRLMLHAVIHDFIRRQAFADYGQEEERCWRNAKAALEDFATVESLFSNRGSDGLVNDLLAMHGMFQSRFDFASLCGDWLSVVHGHSHVFRVLASVGLSNGFAQHVLLFSSVRRRDRIGAMAKRALEAQGRPFFDVKWSSWFIPEQQRTRLLGGVGDDGETIFLAVAPDATWALNYTSAGVLQVWELPSGRLHGRAEVRAGRSFAVSPSGNRLALLDEAGTLHLLDLPSLRTATGWQARPLTLSIIEFARDDLLVGVLVAGDCLLNLELGGGLVGEVEGVRVDSRIVGVYRLSDEELFLALEGGRFALHRHAGASASVRGDFGNARASVLAARRDDDDILVCTSVGLFRVDRLDGTARCINEAFGTGWSGEAAFFGDGLYAVSVTYRTSISLLDLTRPQELRSLSSNTADNIVAGARNAPVFVAGNSYYSELHVWELIDGIPQTVDKCHDREIVNILTVGNGSRFVTTSMDWTAALWDRSTGEKVQRYDGHFDGYAKGLAKTVADDRFLVGYTFRTCLYDVATGEELVSFRPPCDGVTAIAMAPSGTFFLTGSSDGWLLLWDEYGQMLRQWRVGDDEVCSIAISSDENVIVGGMASGSVFALVSWQLRQWPTGRGLVSSVCLSPDGTLLYTAHHNGEVCAWSTVSGGLDCVLGGHSERASGVRLVADGRVLITASHDGSVRFWCTHRREQLEVLHLGQPVSCFDYCEGDASLLIGLAAGDVLAVNRVGPLVSTA
jgi:WD40 repeat protein